MVKEKGCMVLLYNMVLLYKNARCDMNVLDETVGCLNWKREHLRDNKNCIVSVWDESKNQWVGKEDTGTESNTEKDKGLASDSFKRACFNWGIGRELYTAPFIWIPLVSGETYKSGNSVKLNAKLKFKVYHLKSNNGSIVEIGIEDQNGKKRFKWMDKEYAKSKEGAK